MLWEKTGISLILIALRIHTGAIFEKYESNNVKIKLKKIISTYVYTENNKIIFLKNVFLSGAEYPNPKFTV